MGFKCPVCLKDFGRDIKAWEEHCEKEHLGTGKIMVDGVIRIAEGKIKELEK